MIEERKPDDIKYVNADVSCHYGSKITVEVEQMFQEFSISYRIKFQYYTELPTKLSLTFADWTMPLAMNK